MAAGKGTRLHPFTDNNPKPLIRVGGISLIERNILKLKRIMSVKWSLMFTTLVKKSKTS